MPGSPQAISGIKSMLVSLGFHSCAYRRRICKAQRVAPYSTIFLAFCTMAKSIVAASALAPPPDGFSWVEMGEIKGAFLKPDGWHFAYNKGKLLGSFSISQYAPKIGEPMGARFTVYAVSNLSKIDARLVSQRIPDYVRGLDDHSEYNLISANNLMRGSYRGMSVRYQFESSSGSLMRQQIYLANDQTDLLLVIIFESPQKEWEQAWPTGQVLLDNFDLS